MASSIHNNRSPSSKTCVCLRLFNMWCWRAFKWIPVLLILGILSWSYYAYVYQLCIATLESTAQQCAYLVMYHLLLIMLIWSYYQTIFSQLQDIPDKFKLPASELEKLLSAESDDAQRSLLEAYAADLPVLTRTMSGSVRYCNRCVIIKPDRAHHCSICARCVLKMDHHCPWVNNCVCFHNYKFFMLFLGYALVYCLFVMCTCMPFFIKFWKLYQKYKHAHCHDMASKGNFTKQCIEIIEGNFGGATATGRYHVVFAFFVALMFGISLGSLFGYHCYLVSHNRTTLEAFRAPMFRGGADKNGFSMGCFNNFKEVFGQHPHLWLVPIFTSRGDGLEFPVRSEHQLETFTVQQEPHGYESMGTTRSSFGDGIAFPLPQQDEDAESLLSSERWDRWGQRPRPFDDHLESSSYDEL